MPKPIHVRVRHTSSLMQLIRWVRTSFSSEAFSNFLCLYLQIGHTYLFCVYTHGIKQVFSLNVYFKEISGNLQCLGCSIDLPSGFLVLVCDRKEL